MTSAPDPDRSTPTARARLDGWKEIAAHFGRGVRTVQRWEAELQLPIRRIDTGRGQVTYAFVDELDQWRESAVARRAASEKDVDNEHNGAHVSEGESRDASAPARGTAPALAIHGWRRSRVIAGVVTAVGTLAALSAAAWLWSAAPATPGRPASAKVVGDALSVFDAKGRLLWSHRFDFRLTEEAYGRPMPWKDYESVVVDDVDGDASAEVLFVAEPWRPDSRGLFCFSADGAIRFHHVPDPVVKFGEKTYAPPWRGVSVYVSGPSGRRHNIWFVSTHFEEFPTVLEKLDTAGNVSAQYWSDGQISTVVFGRVGGQPRVFVGAINNEYKGASLAVLDEDHPSGSSPAMSEAYRCTNCPAGGPLAFLVFPRLDVTAAIGTHPHVSSVFLDQLGQVLVDVHHDVGGGVPEELRSNAATHYRLDDRFRVIGAELGERLQSVHDVFERKGLLDHAFSRDREARSLWPVRRWEGTTYTEVTRPEARDER